MLPAIRIEEVSKLYRLGEVGTGSLAHDVNRWWHRMRGKEDPYAKIGETNDRGVKGNSEYSWALKDVSFDIQQGEVVGIIGRNGAGKSTLLKILSRVTSPTSGRVLARGRIASLLEVGTGFHPELTGRENIYLNGAILGMRKHEITRKLDEIIDFSGCERYIDTPVKRYSSGMYVRLAFAVAAHLDPEIMIIDEVLAVGDYEFQKKCLGKIRQIRENGGTVVFVSHNMSSVETLCDSAILLQQGMVTRTGKPREIISDYLTGDIVSSDWDFTNRSDRGGSGRAKLLSAQLMHHKCEQPIKEVHCREPFRIRVQYLAGCEIETPTFGFAVLTEDDQRIFLSDNLESNLLIERIQGLGSIECVVRNHNLLPGSYALELWLADRRWISLMDHLRPASRFKVVIDTDEVGEFSLLVPQRGITFADCFWGIPR